MDPMDADIVMSPDYDVDDVDCNAEACSPCRPWLSRLGRLRRNVDGRVRVRRDPVLKKPKKAVTRWSGTASINRCYANGVALICNAIIMANCVAGVEPFLP